MAYFVRLWDEDGVQEDEQAWLDMAHVVKVVRVGKSFGLFLGGQDTEEDPSHWSDDGERVMAYINQSTEKAK